MRAASEHIVLAAGPVISVARPAATVWGEQRPGAALRQAGLKGAPADRAPGDAGR